MYIRFKKLHEDATIPTRGTDEAAGLDIYACEDVTVPACFVNNVDIWKDIVESDGIAHVLIGQATISTGIMVEIPKGYYGKFASRSGLAFNHGMVHFHGTIDSDYRGEIKGLLFNTTDTPYEVKKGDRIAQLIILPYLNYTPLEDPELEANTARGTSGFGSTGK